MQICVNGSFHPSSQPVIRVANRSYRYGDGLFETILLRKGEMPLFSLHMERLYEGIGLLGYHTAVKPADLQQQILLLCQKNDCLESARIRISFSGGNGSLFEDREEAGYVIEARPFDASQPFRVGRLGIFEQGLKAADGFSHLKSASALVYVQAAAFARANGWDEAVVLNTERGPADTSFANIFIVKGEQILTPSLDQGCVAGVLRRRILENCGELFNITEQAIEIADLEQADEIFLTNAVRGIIRVESFAQKELKQEMSARLEEALVKTIGPALC